jgi:hypothetical protein
MEGLLFLTLNYFFIHAMLHMRKVLAGVVGGVLLCMLTTSMTFAMSGPGAGGAGFGNTGGGGIDTYENTYGIAYDAGNQASGNQITDIHGVFGFILATINDIIILLLALGVVWTVYFAFVLVKVDGEKKDEARNSIIYGLAGIFVMVSIWGLVNIFKNTFNVSNNTRPAAPTVGGL